MNERNNLFNGTVNTFYLWLSVTVHMVKDHSENKRKPAAADTYVTLSDQQQVIFYMHHLTDRIKILKDLLIEHNIINIIFFFFFFFLLL